MITDESVERVREAADIVQIVGEHVSLKRQGTDFRGPCPFHQGTHRNFSVSPKKGIYYCFVCHEGGDVFTFLQKRLGMDWPSAVRYVADKSGVVIVEVESSRNKGAPDTREPLWEANAAAADWFRRMLWEDPVGAAARAYVEQRGISRETADRFGLGFAPREIGVMRSHLNTLGIPDERLVEAGLLVRPEETAELRPRFRARLIFPIYDVQGRVIGFGGRLLGPGEPKYLNSSEGPLFSKGKTLYGMNWARHAIRKDDRALVVEGYFDVVRLVAAGIESVVAPMGTALTEAQAGLLRRYTANVFLLYDSDEAGLKATFRSGLELLREGAAVRVVTLPEGEDPDTYVASQGAAVLERRLAEAMDLFDRQVQILERRGWFADLHRKRRAIDKLLPTIRATADPLTRDIYTARLAEAAGVDKALIAAEASEVADRPRAGRGEPSGGGSLQRGGGRDDHAAPDRAPGDGPSGDDGPPPDARPPWQPRRKWEPRRGKGKRGNEPPEWHANEAPPRAGMAAEVAPERNLVSLLLVHRALIEKTRGRMGPDQFDDARLRAIHAALLETGSEASLDEIAAPLDERTQALCFELAQQDPPVEQPSEPMARVELTLEGLLAQLAERELDRASIVIERAMQGASEEEKGRLMREKLELAARKRELHGRRSKLYGKRRDPRR